MSEQSSYQCKYSVVAGLMLAAMAILGCHKPTTEAQPQPSPTVTTTPSTATPTPQQTTTAADELSAVVVRILNKAQRAGGVILRGPCGSHGPEEQYTLPHTAPLEPMETALQEISAKYQNLYWRESRNTVLIIDSQAQAGLLRVRLREFRVVEDREPDRVMAVLWHAPEVENFLRHGHVHFARRADGEKRVLSAPMIVEMKNATVAEILDHIAAGYRQSPPKVWVYRECIDTKDRLVDVQMH